MTRKAPARKRPVRDAVPQSNVVQTNNPVQTSGGFIALLESVAQEILAVTYWFEPAPQGEPYAVTVRFTGRRVDVKGRMQAGDRFTQDETIEQVIPGSGPISLTARIRAITPGEWVVTAQVLGSARRLRGEENATLAADPLPLPARWWRRWAPPVGPDEHMRTCLTPLAHVPGILPGIWGAMDSPPHRRCERRCRPAAA